MAACSAAIGKERGFGRWKPPGYPSGCGAGGRTEKAPLTPLALVRKAKVALCDKQFAQRAGVRFAALTLQEGRDIRRLGTRTCPLDLIPREASCASLNACRTPGICGNRRCELYADWKPEAARKAQCENAVTTATLYRRFRTPSRYKFERRNPPTPERLEAETARLSR